MSPQRSMAPLKVPRLPAPPPLACVGPGLGAGTLSPGRDQGRGPRAGWTAGDNGRGAAGLAEPAGGEAEPACISAPARNPIRGEQGAPWPSGGGVCSR